jgi:hypothetical protein
VIGVVDWSQHYRRISLVEGRSASLLIHTASVDQAYRNAKSSDVRPSSKDRHRVSEEVQSCKQPATERETPDGLAHRHRFPKTGIRDIKEMGRSFFFHHLFFVERLHLCVCVPFTPSFKRQNIHKFVFYSIRASVFGWEWDRVFLYFGQRALGSALCVMYLCSIIAFCFLLSFFSNKTDHVKWKWKRNMEIDNWKMLSGLVAREGC